MAAALAANRMVNFWINDAIPKRAREVAEQIGNERSK
jgi:hypothetical protein